MRFLFDEMLPPAVAGLLVERGHAAMGVVQAGLASAPDLDVFEFAVTENRIIVTENFADFATLLERRQSRGEPAVPVLFVRRSDFAKRGALAPRLADHLDRWATANPDPFVGPHWP